LKRLGVVVHPSRQEVKDAKERLIAIAEERQLTVVDAEEEPCDVVIALGGDGTILRAAGVAWRAKVPLLAVNLGRFGYLSSVDQSQMEEAVDALMSGDLEIDQRMMVEASIPGVSSIPVALNEFVVERAEPARVIEVRVSVGDEEIATYTVDGFIVATPTGSTAYSLSAGGPIVEPHMHALLLTPVSPHRPLWRPVVVGPGRIVSIELVSGKAILTADGQVVSSVEEGQEIRFRSTESPVGFVDVGGYDFFRRIRSRFHIDPGSGTG
jgi:NAD+ kinase